MCKNADCKIKEELFKITFFQLCIVMYLCNKNQQNAHFYIHVSI